MCVPTVSFLHAPHCSQVHKYSSVSSTFTVVKIYRYSTAVGAVCEELQRTHVYVRRQWCQHLRAVLEVQKTMAHWVHMRQARISGDPSVDRLSASMQVRCPSVCAAILLVLFGLQL